MARDLLIGFGAGAFSGAFGVGGGIIVVPLLVLLLHFTQKRAQATSLVMVVLAALAGALTYALADQVAWLPGLFILAGGLAGSWLGSNLVQRTSDVRLQIGFGLVLIAVAIRLLWPQSTIGGAIPDLTAVVAVGYLVGGVGMGVLSALFGIGGGIILIPILVTFFDFPQQLAAGTSLAVMAPIALMGAWRQSRDGATDWPTGLRFGIAAAPGSVLGAAIAVSVSGLLVQALFAVVLIAVGLRMIRSAWLERFST
ncbi:MAG TPA: sulfite exporter TauE/SafE family protein [Candidatus Nanopelagicales bacterium]|nr:sulfite exporter TauE/SafE family protein [Candidatus Nanopelagicales bacterium]